MKRFVFLFVVPLLLSACEPKPKACLNWDDTLEAGTTLTLSSCSEDFDFLTWEFSDDRGYVNNSVERIFEEESDMSVRLTAYSDGAYRSDVVTFPYKTSFRYIDRMEVVGESNFSKLELRMEGGAWSGSDAKGIFTESAPYTVYVWPTEKVIIESKQTGGFSVYGFKNGSEVFLGKASFNFETYKENPMTLETNTGLSVEVYWTFRD